MTRKMTSRLAGKRGRLQVYSAPIRFICINPRFSLTKFHVVTYSSHRRSSLGSQHARIHSTLAAEGASQLCPFAISTNRPRARSARAKRRLDHRLARANGNVDAVSVAAPTEVHCEIACGLLEAGIHVLVETDLAHARRSRSDDKSRGTGKRRASGRTSRTLQSGDARPPPARRNPVYFEIHRIGEFTARSLDIDVVLDLMIHDLDIVQWLVGEDVDVTEITRWEFRF